MATTTKVVRDQRDKTETYFQDRRHYNTSVDAVERVAEIALCHQMVGSQGMARDITMYCVDNGFTTAWDSHS